MTCQVLIMAPNGLSMRVRALLDSGSSASFISERLVQSLYLSRTKQKVSVSGIGGVSPDTSIQSIASFKISPITGKERTIDVTALIVPRVVRDLPIFHIPFDTKWTHLSNLHLADLEFGVPGCIEILLGVDIFTDVSNNVWQ